MYLPCVGGVRLFLLLYYWSLKQTMCGILWIGIVLIACVFGETDPVVDTSVGQIVGLKDEFIKFLGIPYAVVDVNDPFGPAKPHPPFNTPYFANKDPVVCPQIFKGIIQGDIQCLHLNVYKPNNEYQNKTLPVMVFIHGGGFREGDGNLKTYSPIFLIKHDVMVVTVNYRLGPYGFLCLEQDEYSNQGLKDQILALKWIKNNIKQFGGDDNNILLFGHSAGSASIDFHLLFNAEKVYNKVILQSVEMVSLLLIDEPKNHDYLANITSKLGIDSKDLKTVDMIKELSKTNTDLIISMTKHDNFRPCVHNLIIGDKLKINNFKDLKIVIGNAEKEAVLFYTGVVNYTNMIKMDLKKHFTNIPENGVTRAEKFYLTGNLKYNTIDFGCDLFFNHPAIRSIRHYLRNNATIYRYLFTYDGGRNYIKVRDGIDAEGATHGDELGYLFDADLFGDTITATDQSVIDTITTFWTNFAKHGNPTPEDLSSSTWPEIDDNLELYMNIAAHPVLERRYREKEMAFWDSFYKDFGVYSTGFRFPEETEFRKNRASMLGVIISLNVVVVLLRFVM